MHKESPPEITVPELKKKLESGETLLLLDVREPEEFEMGHIKGCVLLPLGQLPLSFGELDPKTPIIIYCKSGIRSAYATTFLRSQGYQDVRNLIGGYIEWKKHT